MDASIAQLHIVLAINGPTRRISNIRINIFQCNWEVDNEQVKIVNAPIRELLAADGLDFVTLVERVPELADEEQIFTLYETVFDGSCDTFTCLFFIAIICKTSDVCNEV